MYFGYFWNLAKEIRRMVKATDYFHLIKITFPHQPLSFRTLIGGGEEQRRKEYSSDSVRKVPLSKGWKMPDDNFENITKMRNQGPEGRKGSRIRKTKTLLKSSHYMILR